MRPIAYTCDEAVLEGVNPAILDVARIVDIVSDQVLPETALPDAALVARDTNGAASRLGRVFAKRLLMSRQRVEKSLSPGGSVKTACR